MAKTFFIGAAKIAVAIFVAGIGLLLAVALYGWATAKIEEREAKPFEEPKTWFQDMSSTIGMNVETNTKLVDGKMLVNVIMRGSPAFINDPTLIRMNKDLGFTIDFVDQHGFKVVSQSIAYNGMTRAVNPDGSSQGLSFQGDVGYVGLKQYAQIQNVQIQWTVETKVPEIAAKPAPTAKPVAEDHCAPGISRQERLKRLSAKGPLRETGKGDYSAGSGSVLFGYDGSVVYCN